MSPDLERRYARLLRLYPKAYREERGPEMLATLAEADRPAGRETAALVLGALRARAGVARAAGAGRLWLSALRVAVLVLVAHATAQAAAYAGRVVFSELLMGRGLGPVSALGYLGAAAAGGSALVALAAGRYRFGVVLIGAAFAFGQWGLSWLPWDIRVVLGEFWSLPLAMLLTVPLLWRRPAASAYPLAWLLAVPLALFLLPTTFDDSLRWQPYPLYAVGVAALVWSVVDARAAVAAAALFLVQVLALLGYYLPVWANGPSETLPSLLTYSAGALVLVAVGAALTRRQARL